MYREIQTTGVDFDTFWFNSVEEGAANFFRWSGDPRVTVLVVWNAEKPTHIECRTTGDVLLAEIESEPILAEVTKLFRDAGYWSKDLSH